MDAVVASASSLARQLTWIVGSLLRERRDHTLQPAALAHEAYLRLVDQRQVNWKNRAQLVGLAAVMMRILVNHARDRAAGRRDGDLQKGPLRASPAGVQGAAAGRRRVEGPIPVT